MLTRAVAEADCREEMCQLEHQARRQPIQPQATKQAELQAAMPPKLVILLSTPTERQQMAPLLS